MRRRLRWRSPGSLLTHYCIRSRTPWTRRGPPRERRRHRCYLGPCSDSPTNASRRSHTEDAECCEGDEDGGGPPETTHQRILPPAVRSAGSLRHSVRTTDLSQRVKAGPDSPAAPPPPRTPPASA